MPPTTIGESLYWSYANLGKTHAALNDGAPKCGQVHYMIRAKLYKGLRTGKMNMGALAEDEKLKLVLPKACCYCGARTNLSVDHLIPTKRGGPNDGENMVWSCKSCNSSKGAKDMLVWLVQRDQFPPLLLLRRYLKLAVRICREREVMDTPLDGPIPELPFALDRIPHRYPIPDKVTAWIIPLEHP